jgi:hypothetical protein
MSPYSLLLHCTTSIELFCIFNKVQIIWIFNFFVNSSCILFFFFFAVLRFELRSSHLQGRHSITTATLPILFIVKYFQNKLSRMIFPGRFWTTVFFISASQVVRNSGMSHWCPAFHFFTSWEIFLFFLLYPLYF